MTSRILLPIILTWFVFPCTAQIARRKNAELGTIQILIPRISFADEKADESTDDEQIARVYLKSKSSAQEMNYKGKGLFELVVQQGIYQILLKDMENLPNPYKRANFFVPSNKITKISIFPTETKEGFEVCNKKEGFVLDFRPSEFDVKAAKDFSREKRTRPLYDKFLAKKPYNLVVRYCQRFMNKQTTSYKFARLTYQGVTIEADRITYDRENSLIEATGSKDTKVWVETENCDEEKQTIKLNLSKLAQLRVNCKQSQK